MGISLLTYPFLLCIYTLLYLYIEIYLLLSPIYYRSQAALLTNRRVCIVEYILSVGLHTLIFFLRAYDKFIPLTKTSTCRNQVSANYILLHTLEIIYLTTDSSLIQNLSSLLE